MSCGFFFWFLVFFWFGYHVRYLNGITKRAYLMVKCGCRVGGGGMGGKDWDKKIQPFLSGVWRHAAPDVVLDVREHFTFTLQHEQKYGD